MDLRKQYHPLNQVSIDGIVPHGVIVFKLLLACHREISRLTGKRRASLNIHNPVFWPGYSRTRVVSLYAIPSHARNRMSTYHLRPSEHDVR